MVVSNTHYTVNVNFASRHVKSKVDRLKEIMASSMGDKGSLKPDTDFEEETLDCPVCLEKYKSPRTLPCQHTFCETCLTCYISTQTTKVKDSTVFECPVCRRNTSPEDPKSPTNTWVKTFPINHLLVSLIDSEAGVSDDVTMCASCRRADQSNAATFWCQTCFEPYCETCHGYHKRMKSLNKHNTVPIENAIQSLPKRLVHVDEDCSIHAGKTIEAYCFDHSDLCCVVCITKSHRLCQNVSPLEELADDKINESRRKEIVDTFSNVKEQVNKMAAEKNANLAQLEIEKEQLVKQMQSNVSTVKEKLDYLMTQFEKNAETVVLDNSLIIRKRRDQIERFEKNLDICGKIMATVAEHGSPKQVFITFERLRMQISNHYQQLNSWLAEDVQVNLQVVVDDDLSKVMNSMKCLCTISAPNSPADAVRELNAVVGEVVKTLNLNTSVDTSLMQLSDERSLMQSSMELPSIHDSSNATPTLTEDSTSNIDLLTSKVKLSHSVTVHDLKQGRLFFSGGAFLGDGRLLLADSSSQRILLFNDRFEYSGDYKIDGRPTDLAAKDQDIYIVVNQSAIFKCREVANTGMTIITRIKAPARSISVELLGDFIIVGTTNSVVIMSQDGSTITSSQTHGAVTHVAVSNEQCTYYLRDGNNIACKSFEGNDVWRFGHRRLKEPAGICLDSNENVYVCGRESGTIFQTSFDGKNWRMLPGKLRNISKPYGIIFHPSRHQFLVTSYGEETLFEVYSFCS